MSGLILKDFLNLKKQVLPLLLFIGIYLVIAIVSKNSGFFSGMAMIFCAMLPISALSYDERAGFTKYALTMPISRSALVISKYAMALILLGTATLASFVVALLTEPSSLGEVIGGVLPIFLVGILIISISLPCIFKFGTEKGRFVMIAICMLTAGLGTFATVSITSSAPDISNESSLIALFSSGYLVIGLLAVVAIMFLISLFISVRIYTNKDF